MYYKVFYVGDSFIDKIIMFFKRCCVNNNFIL